MSNECTHENALEINHDNFTHLYYIRCTTCELRGMGQKTARLAMVAWKAMYGNRAALGEKPK